MNASGSLKNPPEQLKRLSSGECGTDAGRSAAAAG